MEGAEAKRAMEHMAKKMKDIDFKPKDDTIASLLYRRMMEEEGMDEELAKELSQGNPLVKSPKKEAVLKPKDSPPKEENKPEPVPEIKTIKVAQKSTLIKAHVLQPIDWLVDAYGPMVEASEPKRHLFKLLEFNKIEVLRYAIVTTDTKTKVPVISGEHLVKFT